MKIVTILGARPQFIKAAAVSREFAKHSEIEEVIVHTGQHYDDKMSDIFFREMEIPLPKHQLSVNSLNHGAMTGRMLEGIEKIILDEKPDYVMVYGDTNSTLAGSLSAKKLHFKVVHVEAGLRSFNMKMPEEINRILTDRISDVLFCPTDIAIENLKKEGFDNFECEIVKNGDVMQDAALFYSKVSSEKSKIISNLELTGKKYILGTIHRQENTDDFENLKTIVSAFNNINKEISVVIPLHPRTKKTIEKYDLKPEFTIIEPIGYFDMIELIKNSSLVMTDSGGLQKEAFFFRKNCVTLREQTEWLELVENNVNILAKMTLEGIYDGYKKMIHKETNFDINLYGNGTASKLIVETLLK